MYLAYVNKIYLTKRKSKLSILFYEFSTIKICTGYTYQGELQKYFPADLEILNAVSPVYEEMPGWKESTVGAKSMDALPLTAQAYIKRIEALVGVPIDMVSTGPDREETIYL